MHNFEKILKLADGQMALVKKLLTLYPDSKIRQGHINNWLRRDRRVPDVWVIPCCAAVDFKITPHQIRSDLYPHPMDGLPDHLRLGATVQDLPPAHGPECCARQTALST
jgi:hypothetical protein